MGYCQIHVSSNEANCIFKIYLVLSFNRLGGSNRIRRREFPRTIGNKKKHRRGTSRTFGELLSLWAPPSLHLNLDLIGFQYRVNESVCRQEALTELQSFAWFSLQFHIEIPFPVPVYSPHWLAFAGFGTFPNSNPQSPFTSVCWLAYSGNWWWPLAGSDLRARLGLMWAGLGPVWGLWCCFK